MNATIDKATKKVEATPEAYAKEIHARNAALFKAERAVVQCRKQLKELKIKRDELNASMRAFIADATPSLFQ